MLVKKRSRIWGRHEVILINVAKARHVLSTTWICKPQIMKISACKTCRHLHTFWISVLFKYAVRNSPALPLALSRCTLTLSLVLIELLASKGALQWRREWANIWIAKTHHIPRGENSRQLFRVKDTPNPQQANPLHTAQKKSTYS